jgi:hypothetical protein
MKAPRVRVENGTFITHHPIDGFRARCACGWTGEFRGYATARAYEDAAAHEKDGCP